MENEDICSICYDELNNESTTIECGHKYHTNCIIKWFRTGNHKCPLCNDTTIDTSNIKYFTKITTIKEIQKLGRKKNCPINLKKLLNKIKKIKEQQKNKNTQIRDFKKKYKEELKHFSKLKIQTWKFSRQIRELESKLLAQIILNPIYIK